MAPRERALAAESGLNVLKTCITQGVAVVAVGGTIETICVDDVHHTGGGSGGCRRDPALFYSASLRPRGRGDKLILRLLRRAMIVSLVAKIHIYIYLFFVFLVSTAIYLNSFINSDIQIFNFCENILLYVILATSTKY